MIDQRLKIIRLLIIILYIYEIRKALIFKKSEPAKNKAIPHGSKNAAQLWALRCSIFEDPIRIAGGLNLYRAFGNNPINFIDPWGEDSEIYDINYLLDIWIFMSEGVRKEIIEGNKEKNECYFDCVQRCMKKRGINFDFSNIIGMLSNIGFLPKKIGYGFGDFWHGGRSFYYWANQYGSGIKAVTWEQAGLLGSALNIVSTGLTAYTVSGVLFCYGTCLHGGN